MPVLLSEVIKEQGDCELLSFEEVGRATRALREIWREYELFITPPKEGEVRKPGSGFPRSNTLVSIQELDIPLYKEFYYGFYKSEYQNPTPEQQERERKVQDFRSRVEAVLCKEKVIYYYSKHGIYLRTIPNVVLSSFANSDNPEVWKAQQQKFEDNKKIEAVKKALDRKN